MTQTIAENVTVDFISDFRRRQLLPRSFSWRGRLYPVTKLGLHHTYKEGRRLYHVFSVVSQNLFFRLVLNSETLFWKISEISDGLPN